MLCPSMFAKISSTNCLFLTFVAFIWKEPKLSTQLCLRLTTCYKLVIFQYSAWLSIIWVFICKFKNEYFSHSPKLSTQLRLRLTTCFKLVIFQYSVWLSLKWVFISKIKKRIFFHMFHKFNFVRHLHYDLIFSFLAAMNVLHMLLSVKSKKDFFHMFHKFTSTNFLTFVAENK